jgi:hypothetical protein
MRFLLGVCALITLPLWATTQVTTKIHDIDHGDHITDEALVFLTNGKIAKINVHNTDLLNRLNESLQKRELVTFEIDDNREILALTPEFEKSLEEPVPEMNPEAEPKLMSIDPMAGYNASVASESMAKDFFKEQRRWSKEETQCFNRAMVWTYEWRVKHNFYSKKVWIFFTRKFIRKHNFDWWFHVSPLINVAIDGGIHERTMDKKYTNGPLPILKWAKIFLRGEKADCPTVYTYSDHADYPESGSCFLMKSPMYYYQPGDLEFLEKYGTVQKTWNETNIRAAYAESFSIYP